MIYRKICYEITYVIFSSLVNIFVILTLATAQLEAKQCKGNQLWVIWLNIWEHLKVYIQIQIFGVRNTHKALVTSGPYCYMYMYHVLCRNIRFSSSPYPSICCASFAWSINLLDDVKSQSLNLKISQKCW